MAGANHHGITQWVGLRVLRDHNKGCRLGLFGWFSGRGGRIPKRNARALMRIAKEDRGKRVDDAILALARLPHSGDILECVTSFIPKSGPPGPHTSAAIST